MKYMIVKTDFMGTPTFSIMTTEDEVAMTSFPAVVGNPHYDLLLTQAGLTDEQMLATTPGVWNDLKVVA
jgi:hypothetical protein